MLDSIIGKYKVGSILNAPQHALTPQEWNEFIGRIQEASMKEIGIPCIYGLDQNHGVTYTQGGTLFPQNINVAATFNPALAEELPSRPTRPAPPHARGHTRPPSTWCARPHGPACGRISAKTRI